MDLAELKAILARRGMNTNDAHRAIETVQLHFDKFGSARPSYITRALEQVVLLLNWKEQKHTTKLLQTTIASVSGSREQWLLLAECAQLLHANDTNIARLVYHAAREMGGLGLSLGVSVHAGRAEVLDGESRSAALSIGRNLDAEVLARVSRPIPTFGEPRLRCEVWCSLPWESILGGVKTDKGHMFMLRAAYMSWALMTGDTRLEGRYVVQFNTKDIGSLTKPIVVEWEVDCLEHIVPASPASHILVLFEVGTGVEDEVPRSMWLELPRDPAAARGLFPADVGADVQCYLAEVPQVAFDFQTSRVMRSCITCGRIGASQNCGRCKIATYCSKACQLQDWDSHKTPCKFIASTL
jgi:hypothetical protein